MYILSCSLPKYKDCIKFQEKKKEEAPEEEKEEVVDPLPAIREECTVHHCQKLKDKLDTCNERVRSKKKTAETCHEEMVDFIHCVDHCVSFFFVSHQKYRTVQYVPYLS